MSARDGILPACSCNNVKEMIWGKFYQKLNDDECPLKQLELYTPWSNVAEREMKLLTKGAGHKLLQSRAPKHLWDGCLELKANTAHAIYKLDREVPKTVMSCEKSDINQFCELEWYKFEMKLPHS